MSTISKALAKASKPIARTKRLPFTEHYLKSGLFRVCIISLIVAVPLVTLVVRASTQRPVVVAPHEVVTKVSAAPIALEPIPVKPAAVEPISAELVSVEAVTPIPKSDLSADFQSLHLKAITEVGEARVMVGSRIIHLGQDIVPGLKLVKIGADKLVAIDADGARYERGF
jgi:hypothetical protein